MGQLTAAKTENSQEVGIPAAFMELIGIQTEDKLEFKMINDSLSPGRKKRFSYAEEFKDAPSYFFENESGDDCLVGREEI